MVRESRLPGLSTWRRVRDWRVGQIDKLSNIGVFRESLMSVDDVLEVGADHVFVATGSRWTTDGVGRTRNLPFTVDADAVVAGADAVLDGAETPAGRVVIFDDDHYYLGPVIALALRARGNEVYAGHPGGPPRAVEQLHERAARLGPGHARRPESKSSPTRWSRGLNRGASPRRASSPADSG